MNYERGRRDTAQPTGFADMAQWVSQRVLRYVSGVCGRRGLRLHARARVCLCLCLRLCVYVCVFGVVMRVSADLGTEANDSTTAMHLSQLPCVAVELTACKLNQTNET